MGANEMEEAEELWEMSSRMEVWLFHQTGASGKPNCRSGLRPNFCSHLLHVGTYFPVTYWSLSLPTRDNDI